MAEQYVNITVVPIATRLQTDVTPVTMIQANFTPVKKAGNADQGSFVKHHVCPTCSYTYPETEMGLVGGTWYCNRFSHVVEAGLRMQGK